MEDVHIQKVAISGPTLASIIHRISSSLGDVDGLLFGHVSHLSPSTLSDDDNFSDSSDSNLIATVTSFLCFNSTFSFYDSAGRVDSPTLLRFLSSDDNIDSNKKSFIGWFSGRRKTPLRPSMREFTVSRSLSSSSQFLFPVENLIAKRQLGPSIFLLFTTPLQEQLIHTHEYRAYQYRVKTLSFETKPIDIVNIGPAFRGHYGNFTPNNSGFPLLNCELRSAMNEDDNNNNSNSSNSLSEIKQVSKDQKVFDKFVEDFDVTNLSKLMGSEASAFTLGLEDLYEKMLVKIQTLANQVELTNARLLEQENHNRKLRYKVARAGLD